MAIKYSIQGLLIYAAMAAYLLAFATTVFSRRRLPAVSLAGRAGQVLFLCGFAASVVSWVYRWSTVGHVPLQNLFEIFLFLGMMCYPIAWFNRVILKVGIGWAEMLIGMVCLFPAGFVFSAQPQRLPPALQCWLFTPHVAVYMLAYIFMAKATFLAVAGLARRGGLVGAGSDPAGGGVDAEEATYRVIGVGFPFLTLGLILGSWWGQVAWGQWWGWDPKELWSLASWLVYVGYFHFRYMFGRKHPALTSAWAVAGMAVIMITLLWVNLSTLFPGLHSYAM